MKQITTYHIIALIFVGIVLVIQSAHASPGTYWGEYHVGSRHSTPGYYDNGVYHKWNEKNTGGGLSYEVSYNFETTLGFYRNSYNKLSVYGGVDFHTASSRAWRVGVSLGPITGYKDTPQKSRFMVLPNIVLNEGTVRTKIGLIPGDVTVLTLSMGIAF